MISSALWAIESEAHCRVAVGGGAGNWETCPDAELRPTEGFESIGHAFWFTAVTLTTVGYGDVTPYTGGGRALAIAAALSGIVVIAMPIAVARGGHVAANIFAPAASGTINAIIRTAAEGIDGIG